MLRTPSLLAATVLVLLLSPFASAADPSFTPLGDLPGDDFHSQAFGISADGQTVVGWSASAASGGGIEAFRWTAQTGILAMGNLTQVTPFHSSARAASADGSVIVGSASGPFIWTAQTGMLDLNQLSGGDLLMSVAFDVSADGSVVVGVGNDSAGPQGNQAFRWTADDGPLGLGALSNELFDSYAFAVSNDGATITGQSMTGPPDVEAFHWTAQSGMQGLGGLTLLNPGFTYALGWGISADGATIVGQARTELFEEAFFSKQETGMVSLDPLRGTTFFSAAFDASADGSIIVGTGQDGAMIWDAANGMRSLQQILETQHNLDLTGWNLLTARAVSDDGTAIAGHGWNPDGNVEAWHARLPSSCFNACADIDASGGPVNLADFAAFALCFAASPATSNTCQCSDLNADGLINLADFATFSLSFGDSSTNTLPDCP